MKHALLAAVAVAALVFPGLAATATNKTHSSSATRAAVATTATHKMLGAQLPFIRTGPAVGQGYILKRRNPRGPQGALGKALNVAGPASSDNLTYGGPDQIPPASIASLPTVMTSNTNYMIFWLPSGYRMASNYVQVITQYFKDQAHDSWGNDNVDSVAVQYMGTKDGEIYYDSSYGGFAIDTNPFPKSSCMKSYAAFANDLADGHLAMKGVTNCLSDAQLQTEVKRFADAQGWPHGPTNEFFMYTPHNVGSCFSPDSASNAANLANACTWDYYCAYHSSFGSTPSTEYIYANMPWPNQAFSVQGGNQYRTDCDGGEHPNGTGSISNGTDPNGPTDLDAADEVIGVTSHEHNESVTDPTGYGWWVDSNSPYGGYENGDLCAWYWASDGSSFLPTLADNSSDVTNVVNGHSYFTQGEWSNNDATSTGESGCVWGYTASSPTYSGGNTLSGGPQASPGGVLTLTAGDFTGKPVYEYGWVRCSPDTDPFGGIAPRGPISAATVKGFALGQGCTTVQWDFSNMYSNADNTDTYTVTAKDVGYDIYGFVVADDGTGESNGFFAEDGMALAKVSITGEPENTVDPAITPGSGIVPGTSVTLNLGTWSNAPTGYVVQWQHCQDGCTTFKTVKVTPAKTGPTTTKYTVLAADAHYALRAVVTASNKYGADNYDGVSDQTEVVGGYPVPAGEQSWSADPVVGTSDTLNLGSWTVPTGAPITGYTISIERCAVLSPPPMFTYDDSNCELAASLTGTGATHSVKYTPTSLDAGQALVAFVVAKNKYGSSDTDEIPASVAVGGAPANTVAPTFTEATASDGDTVHLNMGTWSPAVTQYRYTLYACLAGSDPTDPASQCVNLGAARTASSTVSVTVPDNSGNQYYLTAFVQGINDNGYGDAVWASTVDVNDSGS